MATFRHGCSPNGAISLRLGPPLDRAPERPIGIGTGCDAFTAAASKTSTLTLRCCYGT